MRDPGVPAFTIAVASEDEVRANALGRRLRQFNDRIVGEYPEDQNVWLNAKDDRGHLLGGFRGEVHFHWLFVNVLFVEESERRKGIGAHLLAEGEAHARRLGARRARLETFDWQAPAFYLKQGYREIARLANYYDRYSLSLMTKDL